MSTGSVKWFNATKGYGFIQPQGGGQDVFVHISAVEKAGLSTLNEGQQVEFEVASNRGKSSVEYLKLKSSYDRITPKRTGCWAATRPTRTGDDCGASALWHHTL